MFTFQTAAPKIAGEPKKISEVWDDLHLPGVEMHEFDGVFFEASETGPGVSPIACRALV